jgi:hypothetical protein
MICDQPKRFGICLPDDGIQIKSMVYRLTGILLLARVLTHSQLRHESRD